MQPENMLIFNEYVGYVPINRGYTIWYSGDTLLISFFEYIIVVLRGLYGTWYSLSKLMSQFIASLNPTSGGRKLLRKLS